MRIIFGWNHFRIATFDPAVFGFAGPTGSRVSIERRQRYFHIFWIPFFATGKTWALRKDGELYELPVEWQVCVESSNLTTKTPWYTYLGLCLLAVGLLAYGASFPVQRFSHRLEEKASFARDLDIITKRMAAPTTDDYYALARLGNSRASTFLKLAEISETAVRFQLSDDLAIPGSSTPTANEVAACFRADPSDATFIRIERQQLTGLVQANYDDGEFQGQAVPGLDPSDRFRLMMIYRLDGPNITDSDLGYCYQGDIRLEFTNEGPTVALTQIRALAGSVEWTSTLPKPITADKRFVIRGKYVGDSPPSYKVELTCEDTRGRVRKFLVEGTGLDRTLNVEP